ncbi:MULTISPECIES: LacI family DNA-binding transcriptional regulator [unclassified Sphingomonas]|uniref:LacI family DNA-binding transcriptional regulator n=1 Tax=unclassified Sphingomonas TaxID=196159 RepID=UPI001F584587|nr:MULTISPECIES: LacI family DNA-binding transcriptional regulator [unclassified Sphingomonas]
MDDIARLANVSKPTVSRVLNDSPLVSAKTRDHVLQIARANGYAVNRNAQRLRQARAHSIAVVLDFGSHRSGAIGDPFVFELLAGISEALSVRRQDLLLSPPGLVEVADFVDLYRSRAADGFILLGQGARGALLRDLARAAIPFVVWGAVEPNTPYCAVGSDNLLGGRLAGERFRAMGKRRWLFVGNTDHPEIALRAAGLRAAAEGADGIVIDELRLDSMAYSLTYERAVHHIAHHPRPDAVFTFSDTAAMAVISAFREAGHLTPDDYALVGYNNIPPSAHFTPAITTIEQQTDIAGAILVEKLMQMVDRATARSAVLPTRMIVRET